MPKKQIDFHNKTPKWAGNPKADWAPEFMSEMEGTPAYTEKKMYPKEMELDGLLQAYKSGKISASQYIAGLSKSGVDHDLAEVLSRLAKISNAEFDLFWQEELRNQSISLIESTSAPEPELINEKELSAVLKEMTTVELFYALIHMHDALVHKDHRINPIHKLIFTMEGAPVGNKTKNAVKGMFLELFSDERFDDLLDEDFDTLLKMKENLIKIL